MDVSLLTLNLHLFFMLSAFHCIKVLLCRTCLNISRTLFSADFLLLPHPSAAPSFIYPFMYLSDSVFSVRTSHCVCSQEELSGVVLLQGLPGLRGEKGDGGERGEKVDVERKWFDVRSDVNGQRQEIK